MSEGASASRAGAPLQTSQLQRTPLTKAETNGKETCGGAEEYDQGRPVSNRGYARLRRCVQTERCPERAAYDDSSRTLAVAIPTDAPTHGPVAVVLAVWASAAMKRAPTRLPTKDTAQFFRSACGAGDRELSEGSCTPRLAAISDRFSVYGWRLLSVRTAPETFFASQPSVITNVFPVNSSPPVSTTRERPCGGSRGVRTAMIQVLFSDTRLAAEPRNTQIVLCGGSQTQVHQLESILRCAVLSASHALRRPARRASSPSGGRWRPRGTCGGRRGQTRRAGCCRRPRSS